MIPEMPCWIELWAISGLILDEDGTLGFHVPADMLGSLIHYHQSLAAAAIFGELAEEDAHHFRVGAREYESEDTPSAGRPRCRRRCIP